VPRQGFVSEDPQKYVVGASLSLIEVKKESILGAVVEGLKTTTNGIVSIIVGLGTLIKEAIVGKADFSTIAGPVGIVGMVGDAASYGLTPLLMFTAIISLNLAVVNLLPFPALDGGRLVFVAVEAITKRRVPARVTGWVNLLGFVLLMILMAAVTFNDINRLF
jgi:regulator of sigma E protease